MEGSYWIWVVGLLVIYGVVLYFLSIRPQKKQEKKMQAMLDALEVGDSIETSGGLFGVVIDVSGDILIVEFGGDKTLPDSNAENCCSKY